MSYNIIIKQDRCHTMCETFEIFEYKKAKDRFFDLCGKFSNFPSMELRLEKEEDGRVFIITKFYTRP